MVNTGALLTPAVMGDLMIRYPVNISNDSASNVKKLAGAITCKGSLMWMTCAYVDTYVGELPADGINGYTVYPAYEGTTVRMFNYMGKWILATTKSLNAFDVYWGSDVSIGDRFVQTLCDNNGLGYDEFCATLNPEYMYVFFVTRANDDRVVCRSERHEVYHIETLSPSGSVRSNTALAKLDPIDTDDVLGYVANSDPYTIQGVFLVKGRHKICIKSVRYAELEKIRAGRSSLMLRYLEIRADVRMYKQFMQMYSERSDLFDDIERRIKKLANTLATMCSKHRTDPPTHPVPKNIRDMFSRCADEGVETHAEMMVYFMYEISNMSPSSLIYLI